MNGNGGDVGDAGIGSFGAAGGNGGGGGLLSGLATEAGRSLAVSRWPEAA